MSAHSTVLFAIIALCSTLLHAEPYSAGILGASNSTCQTSKGRTATHLLEMSTRYTTRQDIRYCSSKGRTAAHSIEMSTRYTTTRQAWDARCLPCSTTVHVSSH